MPTGCADPRCPVNKRRSRRKKSPRDFCKIHGKPSTVTFASDDARENHRERKRLKRLSRSSNADDIEGTRRDRSDCCRRCCKNKKCQTYKNTAERSTSTDPRTRRRIANDNVTRSHALRKSGMQFDHRHKDKERPCECAHKRSCTRGKESGSKMDASGRKGVRRYRSRHKRKGKCNWLINCCGRFCICAKIPDNSMESDVYVKSHAHRNCECCSRSCNNKLHNLRKLDGTGTRKKDKELVGKCRCANSVSRYSALPQDQSYLRSICSKGLNVIRRGMDFRL